MQEGQSVVHIAAHQGNLECLKVFAGLQNAVEIFKVQDKVNANPHALLDDNNGPLMPTSYHIS